VGGHSSRGEPLDRDGFSIVSIQRSRTDVGVRFKKRSRVCLGRENPKDRQLRVAAVRGAGDHAASGKGERGKRR